MGRGLFPGHLSACSLYSFSCPSWPLSLGDEGGEGSLRELVDNASCFLGQLSTERKQKNFHKIESGVFILPLSSSPFFLICYHQEFCSFFPNRTCGQPFPALCKALDTLYHVYSSPPSCGSGSNSQAYFTYEATEAKRS